MTASGSSAKGMDAADARGARPGTGVPGLVWERLRWGLLGAYVLGLGLSISLAQAALTALIVAGLWGLRDPVVRRAMTWPLAAPMAALLGVTVLSVLASSDPLASGFEAKGLLVGLAFYATVGGLRGTEDAERLVWALAIVGAIAAGLGLVQALACPPAGPSGELARWFFRHCPRARGTFSIYMTLAGVLNVILLLVAPRLLPGPARHLRLLPAWLVMAFGLAATQVRGAWLGFVAGLLALVPLSRRGRHLLVGGLAAAVLLGLLGPAPLRDRLLSMADPHDVTVKERLYMWQSGLTLWRERPFLGHGPGGVTREYRRVARPEALRRTTSHLHSSPLQMLTETGILGLAGWLWVWGAFYVRVGRGLGGLPRSCARERALVVGSLAAVTAFLVGGLSEHNFGDSEVAMAAWTAAALPFVVFRDRDASGDAPRSEGRIQLG